MPTEESMPKQGDNTTKEVDLLNHYADEGIKLLRIHPETKNPIGNDWQNRRESLGVIEAHAKQGKPVGWQVGEVSGWISAVDCDWPETVRLAPRFLPETLTIHKGHEKPSLWIYRSEGLGFAGFRCPDASEVLCIKASNNGKGHQVVVPPSKHAVKGAYEFTEGGWNPAAITTVEAGELQRRCRMLATAALISRRLPDNGTPEKNGRHAISLAYAGFMLRNGESPEDVTRVLVAAWGDHSAPRGAIDSLRRNVADTARKIAADEPTTGGRTLEELLPGVPEKIAKFLGWEQAELREGRRNYLRTDLGNAERFVYECRGKAMWCGVRRSWLVWDGTRWVWDDRKHVIRMAHCVARTIFSDAQHTEDKEEQKAIAKWAMTSQSEARINAMISQAAPYLAVGMEELDTDPWVLNCQNGTLDLKTGSLKQHDPTDLITKIVSLEYDLDAKAPRFEQFLREALVEDDVISFVKRFSGYTLTGVTRERVLAILYGFGKNGKSTLIELLQEVMGDYSTNTDVETLLIKKGGGVPNDVAALKGARFVSAAEVEKGRRLAESKVKQLTGNDTVTARYLFGEPFNFKPEFKLWLSTNHKPEIRGTDDAIWDRIRLIPFTQRFEGSKADPNLPETLREEMAGVLAWLVEGCLEWQEHGLCEPERVTKATQGYREEMDTLAAFFEEHCVLASHTEVPATPLYERYVRWCEKSGEPQETQKAFGMRLSERGFESIRLSRGLHKGKKGWRGIGFRVNDPSPDDDNNPTLGNKKATSEGSNGSPSEPSAGNGSPAESGLDMRDGGVFCEEVYDGEPKKNKNRLDQPRVGKNMEKRFTSFTSPSPPPSRDPQRPLSYDAKPGESTTVAELKQRRQQQENDAPKSEEEAALEAAGWKQRDRGDNSFWLHPESGFAYSREIALKYIDGNVPGREY